jgi:hypothetical protein
MLLLIAYTIAMSPAVTVSAPSRSARPPRAAGLAAGMYRTIRAIKVTPIGTLTRKIHCHPGPVVSRPPAITPTEAALPPTAPNMPNALVRRGPSAKVLTRIDSAAGAASAPPSPCPEREITSWPSESASPAVSEETVNRASPASSTRRWPSRSAARPPSSRKPPSIRPYVMTTHCRSAWSRPRSACSEGSATFTTARSSTTMNCAPHTRTRTSQG